MRFRCASVRSPSSVNTRRNSSTFPVPDSQSDAWILSWVTVTDAEGNSDTDVQDLRVRDGTAPTILARLDREVTVGEVLVLDASSSSDNVGIVRYTWSFEEGGRTITLEGERVEHTFEEVGSIG